jgi:hypothetical protein
MQEITDWLTKLGLPEYAGAFAENGFNLSRRSIGAKIGSLSNV